MTLYENVWAWLNPHQLCLWCFFLISVAVVLTHFQHLAVAEMSCYYCITFLCSSPFFSPHENWSRHAFRVICYWLMATAYWFSKPTKQKPTPYEQTMVHGISLCRNLTRASFLWSPCLLWAFAELSYPSRPWIRFCFFPILLCWQLDWPNQLHCLRLPLLTGLCWVWTVWALTGIRVEEREKPRQLTNLGAFVI